MGFALVGFGVFGLHAMMDCLEWNGSNTKHVCYLKFKNLGILLHNMGMFKKGTKMCEK